MTDRERVLKIYSGQSIDWRNWDAYLLEFVCRCAELAKGKGYTTFGVQYYGECWSGPHGEDTYANRGVSGDCQDECFETCKPYQKFCAGKNFANAVYRLSDAPCEITFEPVGCHGENAINRAFTTELVNEVNPTSSKFDGVMMEYGIKWQGEFKKLLCRCARQANQKGYSMFGVHNHGECWSATHASQRYNKHGPSQNCFQNNNQTCPQGSDACAGGADANYVYRIVSKPSYADEDKVADVASKEERL